MAKSGLISLFRFSSGDKKIALCTLPAVIPGISLTIAIPSEYIMTPFLTLSAAACSSGLEFPLESRTTPSASVSEMIRAIPLYSSSFLVLLSQGIADMKNLVPYVRESLAKFLNCAVPPGRSL